MHPHNPYPHSGNFKKGEGFYRCARVCVGGVAAGALRARGAASAGRHGSHGVSARSRRCLTGLRTDVADNNNIKAPPQKNVRQLVVRARAHTRLLFASAPPSPTTNESPHFSFSCSILKVGNGKRVAPQKEVEKPLFIFGFLLCTRLAPARRPSTRPPTRPA